MPRRPRPTTPPLTLTPPAAAVPRPAPQLALGGTGGVRVVLDGADAGAVETAAAALKARFGVSFAVTGRRRGKTGLTVTGSLMLRPDDAFDAAAPKGEG